MRDLLPFLVILMVAGCCCAPLPLPEPSPLGGNVTNETCPYQWICHSDGTCVCAIPSEPAPPTGECMIPADCEGLMHIMCVGAWYCEDGMCAYRCDVQSPV